MSSQSLEIVGNLVIHSNNTVVLTGAGISVDSNIPAFRGDAGVWTDYNPEEYATLSAFQRNPAKCWELFLFLFDAIRISEPNAAHRALAQLERTHHIATVITQNIDGLHQAAGQKSTIELHGSIRSVVCQSCHCHVTSDSLTIDRNQLPPRCTCGGVFKPDVILFEEPVQSDRFIESYLHIQRCKLLILIGTSGMVHPANRFPEIAQANGATIIDINPIPSLSSRYMDAIAVREKATDFLPHLVQWIQDNDFLPTS